MIRNVILASIVALASSCIDQGQPDVGTTDQDLAINPCIIGGTCYSNVLPTPWNDRAFTSVWDYWDPTSAASPSATASFPNLQMIAFVVNGSAAVLDPVSGGVVTPATRLVWLISNRTVFRVYEVNLGDVAEMEQIMRNAFTIVENNYAALGYSTPGSTIIAGVDGGIVIKKGGGGPPHGYPIAVVNAMIGYANVVRPVIVNIQNAVHYD